MSDAERLLQERLAARLARARRTPDAAAAAPAIPRLPADAPVPMSFAQRRLWFLHQYDPADPAYNIPVAFWLYGELDLARLDAALTAVVREHEVLHTRYPAADGEPHPSAEADRAPELRVVDAAADLPGQVAADVRVPFDLAVDLPVRATVYRQDDRSALLLLEVHHIAADGWSLNLIVDDLARRYAEPPTPARSVISSPEAGGSPTRSEISRPLRYADVAAWQNARLAGDRLGAELDWWSDRLGDAPRALELPIDRPRPAVATTTGARFEHVLPPALAAQVRAGGDSTGVTPFMLCLSALGVALGRVCRTDDLVVGVPVAGRLRPELETIVGCFVNTLALRVDLSGRPTGAALLDRIRAATLDAYEHQELPFEKLVEHLAPQRDLSTSALFQVMLNVHNQPLLDLRLPGLRTEWYDVSTATTKFDLNLAVVDDGDLTVGFTYNRDLFEPATAHRLAEAFELALAGLCATPEVPVADLPLTGPADRARSAARRGPRLAVDPRPVPELILAQAARVPDAVAVRSGERSLTYAELAARSAELAAALGPRRGEVVGLYLEPSVDWVAAMLAVLRCGAAYVPLDARYPTARVAALLADAGATAVLTTSDLLAAGPLPVPAVLVDALPRSAALSPAALSGMMPQESAPTQHYPGSCCSGSASAESGAGESSAADVKGVDVAVGPDEAAYLLFTSGSTGRPKAVTVPHGALANYLAGLRDKLDLTDGLAYAQVSTLAADLGNTNIFGALTGGGTLHLLGYEQATDPELVSAYFAAHRVDVMKLVPSHFDVLLGAASPETVVPQRTLILAGEACRPELVRRARELRPGLTVHNHYGPTETTVSMLGGEVPVTNDGPIPLGTPFGNVTCHVLDAGMQPVADGLPGELYIGGPGVARGYHGRPGLTADRFLPDPFGDVPGARLYRTGDRVRRRPDGALVFLGRVDLQLKIRGYRVEPAELEAVLAADPDVTAAAVRAWGTPPRLAAYLVLPPGVEDVGPVRDRLRAAVPDYLVPAALVVLPALPLSSNGKLDRAALPEPEAPTGGEYVAPRTELEIELAAAYAEVLGVERVGLDDDFFALGGESFAAVRVARAVGRPSAGDAAAPVALRVIDIFTHPTVRALAARLAGPVRDDGLLVRLTRPGTTRTALVCVPYGGGNAVTYRPLADAMPADTALYAVQLPGHDPARPDEPVEAMTTVAERCAAEIVAGVPGDVVVYGHCLGGALAVEIARRVEAAGRPVRGVVLAGHFPAARLPGRLFGLLNRWFPADRWISTRSYREFLRSLGGVDDLAPPAEQEQLIAALRHDLREAEEFYTQVYDEAPGSLAAPILCVVGERDRATELYAERVAEWEHFTPDVELAVLPRAGHYFLKHQADELAAVVTAAVTRWRTPASPAPTTPAPTTAAPTTADPSAAPSARLCPASGHSNATFRAPQRPPAGQSGGRGGRRAGAGGADGGRAEAGGRVGTGGAVTARPSLRAFGVLAAGQFVSLIGTSLSAFALGVWVFQQTGQVTAFALTLLTATAPAIVAAPLAGAVADRYNRRLVMIGADTLAFLAMAVLALLYLTGVLTVWHVYVVTAVGSLANAFQRPAYFAAIAQLVPKRYLGRVNGIAQLGLGAGELIAPLIGGALVLQIGLGGILAVDAATFAIGLVTLLAIRIPDLAFHRREEPLGREIVAGWRYILRRPGLVAMVVFFVVFNFLFSLPQALITPLVLTTADPATLGLVAAAAGVGILVGNVTMSVWGGTERRATGMIGGTVITGLAAVVAGLGTSPWLLGLGMFGLFASLMVINAHWLALIQTKVGLELQGRVLATNQMLATSTLPLGFLAAGPLVGLAGLTVERDVLAIQAVLLGTGAVLAVWGVLGLRWRRLRRLEDDLPDAVPDAEVGSRDEEQAAADRLLSAGGSDPRTARTPADLLSTGVRGAGQETDARRTTRSSVPELSRSRTSDSR